MCGENNTKIIGSSMQYDKLSNEDHSLKSQNNHKNNKQTIWNSYKNLQIIFKDKNTKNKCITKDEITSPLIEKSSKKINFKNFCKSIDYMQPSILNKQQRYKRPYSENKIHECQNLLTENNYANINPSRNKKIVREILSDEVLYNIDNEINNIIAKLRCDIHNDLNYSQEKLEELLNFIQDKFNNYDYGEFINCNNKSQNILCPASSSATEGKIYHANKILLSQGNYIAAQGPTTQLRSNIDTTKYFITMLAENNSFISVSLVNGEKFNIDEPVNHMLPPNKIDETIYIPQGSLKNLFVSKAVLITKINSIENTETNIIIDFLEINDFPHIRIYDLGWKNDTATDPFRIIKISAITEYLLNLPIFTKFKQQPVVVNCNLGVVKTGMFICINNMMRDYFLNKTIDIPYMIDNICVIKQSRPNFIQTTEELKTLMHITERHQQFFDIFADILLRRVY